jgi:hypothetical protein
MTSQETTDPYEGMRTRQHWKRENAARVLADWVESGESMTAFTRRHQLSLHRLQWWRAQQLSQPLRTTIGICTDGRCTTAGKVGACAASVRC